MNDFIETPEGARVRYTRPGNEGARRIVVEGELREPGRAYIDQWCPPEPPETT
ncbi:MAG TPA: hypothetical protein V6D47_02210 [Oscillatoriaceae cyanobacterium]